METTLHILIIVVDCLGILFASLNAYSSYFFGKHETMGAWICAALWAFNCLIKDLK